MFLIYVVLGSVDPFSLLVWLITDVNVLGFTLLLTHDNDMVKHVLLGSSQPKKGSMTDPCFLLHTTII